MPFPPSLNHLYRRVGFRTLISREGRRFREKVCGLLAASGLGPMTGSLVMEIEYYPPDRRVHDLDNLQKGLLDALQHGGLYRDDSQIVTLIIEKREPVPGGKTLLRIRGSDA